MFDKLKERMSKLAQEAEDLVNRRSDLENEIETINVRLAHIVGAMQELESIYKEIEDGRE
jgi:hypothetical protein